MKRLKWLSNIYDPKLPHQEMYITRRIDETPQEALYWHNKWLEGKIIGEPEASDTYSVLEMIEQGLVGVYVYVEVEE